MAFVICAAYHVFSEEIMSTVPGRVGPVASALHQILPGANNRAGL